jgi:hypothetical protein
MNLEGWGYLPLRWLSFAFLRLGNVMSTLNFLSNNQMREGGRWLSCLYVNHVQIYTTSFLILVVVAQPVLLGSFSRSESWFLFGSVPVSCLRSVFHPEFSARVLIWDLSPALVYVHVVESILPFKISFPEHASDFRFPVRAAWAPKRACPSACSVLSDFSGHARGSGSSPLCVSCSQGRRAARFGPSSFFLAPQLLSLTGVSLIPAHRSFFVPAVAVIRFRFRFPQQFLPPRFCLVPVFILGVSPCSAVDLSTRWIRHLPCWVLILVSSDLIFQPLNPAPVCLAVCMKMIVFVSWFCPTWVFKAKERRPESHESMRLLSFFYRICSIFLICVSLSPKSSYWFRVQPVFSLVCEQTTPFWSRLVIFHLHHFCCRIFFLSWLREAATGSYSFGFRSAAQTSGLVLDFATWWADQAASALRFLSPFLSLPSLLCVVGCR